MVGIKKRCQDFAGACVGLSPVCDLHVIDEKTVPTLPGETAGMRAKCLSNVFQHIPRNFTTVTKESIARESVSAKDANHFLCNLFAVIGHVKQVRLIKKYLLA